MRNDSCSQPPQLESRRLFSQPTIRCYEGCEIFLAEVVKRVVFTTSAAGLAEIVRRGEVLSCRGPLAPRKGGATLPATLQILKGCTPLFSINLKGCG